MTAPLVGALMAVSDGITEHERQKLALNRLTRLVLQHYSADTEGLLDAAGLRWAVLMMLTASTGATSVANVQRQRQLAKNGMSELSALLKAEGSPDSSVSCNERVAIILKLIHLCLGPLSHDHTLYT